MKSECPRCHAEIEDLDGFGVLAHADCGYCSHPSITGGRCDICGLAEMSCACEPPRWRVSEQGTRLDGMNEFTCQHCGFTELRPWPTDKPRSYNLTGKKAFAGTWRE